MPTKKTTASKPKADATEVVEVKKNTAQKSAKTKKTEPVTDVVPAEAPKAPESPRIQVVNLMPRVSEKAAMLADKGIYVFLVDVNTNKSEVRFAVEKRYGVKVDEVRMMRGEGKEVRRGRVAGRRNSWKKAVVALKPGQTLNLYEGV